MTYVRKGTGGKQHAGGRTSTMLVGEQAQVRGKNTIQVRRKIQYSQEKGKTGKVMCDKR